MHVCVDQHHREIPALGRFPGNIEGQERAVHSVDERRMENRFTDQVVIIPRYRIPHTFVLPSDRVCSIFLAQQSGECTRSSYHSVDANHHEPISNAAIE